MAAPQGNTWDRLVAAHGRGMQLGLHVAVYGVATPRSGAV